MSLSMQLYRNSNVNIPNVFTAVYIYESMSIYGNCDGGADFEVVISNAFQMLSDLPTLQRLLNTFFFNDY